MNAFSYFRHLIAIWLIAGFPLVSAETPVNGSFESGLDGWTSGGNVSIQYAPPYSPTDGTKLVAFNTVNSAANGWISQTVGMPGQSYHKLSFDVGNLAYSNAEQRLLVHVTETTFQGVQTLLEDLVIIPAGTSGTTNWISKEYTLTSVTSQLTLTFSDASTSTNAVDLVLDKVRLTPSFYFSVNSPFDIPYGTGLAITASPVSLENRSGGTTQVNLTYFQGTSVTLTAPTTSHGKTFHEWTINGLHYSSNATISLSVDVNYMVLKAVYFPVISLDPEEPFVIKGFAGSGPFDPINKGYGLINSSSSPVEWTTAFQVTSGSSDGSWLSVWPPGGTLAPGERVFLRVMATGRALDLPAGKHEGHLVISSSLGNQEIAVSLAALDPDSLLANGSFEPGLGGWTASGNVISEGASPYASTQGTRLAAFNAVNSPPNGVLSQVFPTETGVRYSLDFDAGVLAYNNSEQRLRVEVRTVTDPLPAPLVNNTISIFGTGGGNNNWFALHYEFVAEGPLTTLTFQDVSPGTGNIDLVLDHVRVFNPDFHIQVNTLADENDPALDMGTGNSLREAISAAALRPGANLIDFASYLNTGTITLGGTQLDLPPDVSIDASALPDGINVSGAGLSRVFNNAGPAVIRNLNIANGNSASDGGGIYNSGTLMLVDSAVENNTAVGYGGGVLNYGSLDVMKSTITENHSSGPGGGVFNGGGLANFTTSTVSGNSTATNGGGLSCSGAFGGAWIVLTNSTVSGNTSAASGGAYCGLSGYKQSGTLDALNTTFSGNTAALAGGAICGSGFVDLRNCTVSANSATGPSGEGGGISNATLTLANSIVAGNSAALNSDISSSTLQPSGVNFIGGDPQLGPLGPPHTFAGIHVDPPQFMSPSAGSPVLDAAGNPAGMPATDERGKPRISGIAMDIGAVETQQILVNTLVDENDGVNAGGISLRDALNPYPPVPPELIRFAPALSGGTILLNGSSLFVLGQPANPLGIDATNLPGGLTISGNHLSGVFSMYFTDVVVRGLTITGSLGTAIEVSTSNVTLADCVIRDNTSTGDGAGLGVYDVFSTFANVVRCTFENNVAAGSGGAIFNSALVWVRDSTFSGNHSGSGGGAISSGIYRVGMVVINSTFSGNSSDGPGGAIKAGSLRLIQSTIAKNDSLSGPGGGIFSTSTTGVPELGFTIANSVVAGNTAPGGSEIAGPIDAYYGHNFIGGNPKLAPLDDYGGATATRPPLPGSPLIDAAVTLPDAFPNYQADVGHDQREAARPNGTLPDIGAVEAFPFSTLPLMDSDGDGIDDRLEPAYGLTVGTNDSARDSDGDGSPDAVEIANMTDPTDSSSILKILSFTPGPGFDPVTNPLFDITFSTFPGLSYTLECDQYLGFPSPAARVYPHGPAAASITTERLTLLPGHDFVRVRRDP